MRRSLYLCQTCKGFLAAPIRPALTSRRVLVASTTPARRKFSRRSAFNTEHIVNPAKVQKQTLQSKQFWGNDWTVFSADNAALVTKAQSLGNAILNEPSSPPDEELQTTLEFIKYAALQLNAQQNTGKKGGGTRGKQTSKPKPIPNEKERDPLASAGFLSDIRLEPSSTAVSLSIATKLLSTLAYKIVKHPPVFLSPDVLQSYVAIQVSLNQMESLPEVFDLYAHKPVPEPNSSPIKYVEPNPRKANQAINEALANQALDAAIADKNLTLSLDIISSTFAMPAYRRNKFVRKALPFLSAIFLLPATALPMARSWATTSLAADPTELTIYTFMGIMTYAGSVLSLGYIALTTHNDQMQRVSWMPGMPLKDRWIREEERAAADKVALAWGFKDVGRRGEEEGEEWAILREWCGMRGMFVDATELMEGME